MKKLPGIWFLFISILLVSAVFLKFFVFSPTVCIKDSCLRVELASTPAQREKGLMFRKHLAGNSGMLFIFPEDDLWSFWMKNTLIPLDIIWLDADKKVVDMVIGAQPAAGDNPHTFKPVFRCRYVLEANSGFVEKNNVSVGDKARFKWI